MNKTNIIAFLAGVSGVVVAAYLIVIFTTPSAKMKVDPSDQYVNEQTVSDIKDKTSTLDSYGDLPVQLKATDIGKNDPFSNY